MVPSGHSVTHGDVAAGYEPVAVAFEQNFSERGELGAAFAAYVDGELVVDLWGGVADRETRAPWRRDTLQLIYSGTKGLVAVCLLVLIERGGLDLDAPVCRYWPEFAAQGKDTVLVRHVVSHQAGLPGVRTPIDEADILDPRRMAALLAAERPFWPPGERVCYHPLTFGWLCGELVRRVDGRRVGRFFAEEIAEPLGLDAWIGLPDEHEPRVSRVSLGANWATAAAHLDPVGAADPLVAAVWHNPAGRFREPLAANRRDYHAAEIAAGNGIATARSIARLYGCLARGGEIDGTRLLSDRTLRLGRACLASGPDALMPWPWAFGVGFNLQTELRALGRPPAAFGHGGTGGSLHGAWPQQRVGFSYAMNELRDPPDARAPTLLEALHDCLR
jgi:CubicO group peptidase (beta-lactamase class C family)